MEEGTSRHSPLLCCSETSLNSWWVTDEIRKAMERERRDGSDIIIPLMVNRYLLDRRRMNWLPITGRSSPPTSPAGSATAPSSKNSSSGW